MFYECEGQYLCGAVNRVSGWQAFLSEHAESELVGNVLGIVEDAFTAMGREAASAKPRCEGASHYGETLSEFLDGVEAAAASFATRNVPRGSTIVSNARHHLRSYLDVCAVR